MEKISFEIKVDLWLEQQNDLPDELAAKGLCVLVYDAAVNSMPFEDMWNIIKTKVNEEL